MQPEDNLSGLVKNLQSARGTHSVQLGSALQAFVTCLLPLLPLLPLLLLSSSLPLLLLLPLLLVLLFDVLLTAGHLDPSIVSIQPVKSLPLGVVVVMQPEDNLSELVRNLQSARSTH